MIKKHFPLIIALELLGVVLLVFTGMSMAQNQGHVVYALDDAYIHMAIARNFAAHGIWGVTPYQFSSSSSSLLWTLLLSAVYLVTGPIDVAPLVLNVVFAVLALVWVYRKFQQHAISPLFSTLALLGMVFFSPLPPVIFCGLEHPLHMLLTLPFLYTAAVVLETSSAARPPGGLPGPERLLLVLAPLVCMARFEGIFLVFVVCVLFLLRRRYVYAVSLGGAALLPILAYGGISLLEGWYFFPNSVMLKGSEPARSISGLVRFALGFSPEGAVGVRAILEEPHVLMLVLGGVTAFFVLYRARRTLWDASVLMVLILVATTLLHMQFAKTGWFYRYEAYLVVAALFALPLALREYLPHRIALTPDLEHLPTYVMGLAAAALVLTPFLERSGKAFMRTPVASSNIYEQQYQMGRFLKTYYQGQAVIANDIGAIDYQADLRLLDIWGLGSFETADAKRHGRLTSALVSELAKARGVRIAVAYEDWFTRHGGLPPGWRKVGEWTIRGNTVCAESTVAFIATGPEAGARLSEQLEAFAPQLPRTVVWKRF